MEKRKNRKKEKATPKTRDFFELILVSPSPGDIAKWAERLSNGNRLAIGYYSSIERWLDVLPVMEPDAIIIDDRLPQELPLSGDITTTMKQLLMLSGDMICRYYGPEAGNLRVLSREYSYFTAMNYDSRQAEWFKQYISALCLARHFRYCA